MRVPVLRLPHYPDEWDLPAYGTAGAAGVDLRNAGPSITLESGRGAGGFGSTGR